MSEAKKESKRTIYEALFEAKQQMTKPRKNSKNDYFNSSYANLGEIMRVAIPALNDAGVLVSERVWVDKEVGSPVLEISLVLVSDSNECIVSFWQLKPEKPTPQGFGSALSYGRRYLLQTMCGLSADDDDGNVASKPQTQSETPSETQPESTVDRSTFPQIVTGYLIEVTSKEGTSRTTGKPWTLYGIKLDSGDWFSTFSESIAEKAKRMATGTLVEIHYLQDGKYKNIQQLFAVGQQDQTYSSDSNNIPF